MKRRNFLQASASTLVTTIIGNAALASESTRPKRSNKTQFKLKYAPSLGAFPELAGKDPIEVVKFCDDQGFRAIFDNGYMNKDKILQDKISNELSNRNKEMGPFVLRGKEGWKTTMVYGDKETSDHWYSITKEAIEVCERTNSKQILVVPGNCDTKLDMGYQTANVIDCLRRMTELCEKAGVTIVLEPLNHWNHPGLFLTGMPQSYAICRAINSPSCKIVDDLYHQQITEGNLIPNIDLAYDEIGVFHLGDNPGRKEPGTGEINFKNVFKHIYEKGYQGTLCMEHGRSIKGKKGEQALLGAYREADSFDALLANE